MRLYYKDSKDQLVQARSRIEWAEMFQDEMIEISRIGNYKIMSYFLGADNKHKGLPTPYETIVIQVANTCTDTTETVIKATQTRTKLKAAEVHKAFVEKYSKGQTK